MPCASSASWAVRDTIILDGETIYIEKKEVVTDLDSLQEAASHDLRARHSDRNIPLILGIYGGANLTNATHSGRVSSFSTLNNFMQMPTVKKLSFTAGLELGYAVIKKKTGALDIEMQIFSGIGFNKINIGAYSLDENAMDRDSVIQLNRKGDNLELIYFEATDTIENTIIGELRTIGVSVEEKVIELSTIDIPLKFRFLIGKSNSQYRFFLDAGILYRMISIKSIPNQFLVSPDGRYLKIDGEKFDAVDKLIYPHFAFGAMRSFDKKDLGKNLLSRLSLGASLQAQLKDASVNMNSNFKPKAMTFQALLFLNFHL